MPDTQDIKKPTIEENPKNIPGVRDTNNTTTNNINLTLDNPILEG